VYVKVPVTTKARRWIIALIVVTISALSGPSAQAAAIPAPTVGDAVLFSKFAFGHGLVVDASGNATLVWIRSVSHPEVLAAHRPAGGAWSAWAVIGRGTGPQVGVSATGAVVAAWRTLGSGLDTARLRPDGSWTRPRLLTGPHARVLGFDLAVAPAGAAAVAWTHATGSPAAPRQISWVHHAPGKPWTDPRAVTPAGFAKAPLLGLSSGRTTLVYGVQRLGHPQVVRTRSTSPGGSWTRPHTLTRAGSSVDLAVAGDGAAIVVFKPGTRQVLKTVARPAGGRWGTPALLSPVGVHVDQFALDMNRQGDAVLAWVRGQGGVDAQTRTAAGDWSEATRLSSPGVTSAMVDASINQSGDSLVAWGYFGLEASSHLSGSTWSEPALVHRHGNQVLEDVELATGPDGAAIVLYKHEDTALRARDVWPATP
jgi:hypothetical protein